MKSASIELRRPKSSSAFLWKYIDLHRFIYLITESKFFFARLDKFEDPFEGVATSLLKKGRRYASVPLDANLFPKSVPEVKRQQLISVKKFLDFVKKHEAQSSQRTQFVNCWFSDERESMAMWNLFSNADSVALRVRYDDLATVLKQGFAAFNQSQGESLRLIGDNVKYLKLNPFDKELSVRSIRYSAFKKDKSFEYEKEYRFLLLNKKRVKRLRPYYSVPVDLSQMKLTVISHPNMEDWKFDNLAKIIRFSNQEVNLERSPILLKNRE